MYGRCWEDMRSSSRVSWWWLLSFWLSHCWGWGWQWRWWRWRWLRVGMCTFPTEIFPVFCEKATPRILQQCSTLEGGWNMMSRMITGQNIRKPIIFFPYCQQLLDLGDQYLYKRSTALNWSSIVQYCTWLNIFSSVIPLLLNTNSSILYWAQN